MEHLASKNFRRARWQYGQIIEVGCHAHARRYFFDAKETDAQHACHVLALYSRPYDVEREAKGSVRRTLTRDQKITFVLLRTNENGSVCPR